MRENFMVLDKTMMVTDEIGVEWNIFKASARLKAKEDTQCGSEG
jgi:hypothetical protein